jgi:hypothetical protein
MKKKMDLYIGYLLSSFGQVTATGLSGLLRFAGILFHSLSILTGGLAHPDSL